MRLSRSAPADPMIALALAARLFAQDAVPVAELPSGWRCTREIVVEERQLVRFEEQLGVPLDGVANRFYDVRGAALQVNTITASDEAGAATLHAKLAANGRERFIVRHGRDVVEFAKTNELAASALRHGLGLGVDDPVRLSATFEIVCVARGDDMEGNEVFNLVLGRDAHAAPQDVDARIAELTSDWTFGDTLRLAAPTAGHAIEYTFEPAALATRREGDVFVATFGELPRRCGLPFVRVTAVTTIAPWYEPRAGEPIGTAATAHWPSDDAAARAIVARLVTDDMSPREKLDAVFTHVAKNIRYGGEPVGSRHGALQVLEQGFGRCWDKSDALVTLLRAAGLPAREVAGWLTAPPTGHVWVEVYLADEGWLALDPTCTWFGTSIDYVPWLRTDDGHMPVVYVSLPTFERL